MHAPAWPVKGERGGRGLPPPGLGEHTEQVLRRVLGVSADDIIRLRADGTPR
jgi:crotonobetainyl-CoA:carnitine CoA-transferase CaiB-like acyl-CoA transferase